MPPSTRTFYSPTAPQMLSESEISSLTSIEIQIACDQIDQNMVTVLGKIDEDFAKCNSILFDEIIPTVGKFEQNSAEIWESIKFWKHFFDASISIKLQSAEAYNDQESIQDNLEIGQGEMEGESFALSEETLSQPNPDRSLSFNTTSSISPPVLKSKFPLTRLGDLSLDSPDFPRYEYSMDGTTPQKVSAGYQDSPIQPSGQKVGKGQSSSSNLLGNLLNKNLMSGRKSFGADSPQERMEFPPEVTKGWNGIANLSTIGLDAFQSPIKPSNSNFTAQKPKSRSKYNESSLLLFDSPIVPATMQYSYQPSPMPISNSKYESTPGRPKAMDRESNLMEFRDSPIIEPPSVMKNWNTRGYGQQTDSPISTYKDKGKGKQIEIESPEMISNFGEGVGTTQRIDLLLESGDELARIVNDEEDEEELELNPEEDYQFDDSYLLESLSQPDPSTNLLGEGPEDTLFGMQQRRNKNLVEDSFELEKGFQLRGAVQYEDTMHGGVYIADVGPGSPLDGR